MSSARVAIIGAGVTGLTCARALTAGGLQPVIFDKGRGLGGRLATRRADDGFQLDHGAPHVAAQGLGFQSLLQDAEACGALAPWPTEASDQGFVGLPGMTGFAKHLAQGLDIRRTVRVDSITQDNGQWVLKSEAGRETFDHLILTVPAPQAIELLPDDHALAAPLQNVVMDPCLTLMLSLPEGTHVPFVTKHKPSDDIAWIVLDSSKPGRPAGPCIVAHASLSWSQAHLELEKDEIADLMLPLVLQHLPSVETSDLPYVSAHRWRYARASTPLGQAYLADDAGTVLVGGDWCLGASAEDAWTSGTAMAEALLAQLES